jgi:hypothetical protein
MAASMDQMVGIGIGICIASGEVQFKGKGATVPVFAVKAQQNGRWRDAVAFGADVIALAGGWVCRK